MNELKNICAPDTNIKEEMIPVTNKVSLRVISFTPEKKSNNPPVLFIAGWITLIEAWKKVLKEMTKDFQVHYVETREKISSQVTGRIKYGVEDIGQDIVTLVDHFKMKDQNYILFGSSLGATSILESCQYLETKPLCLVVPSLVGGTAREAAHKGIVMTRPGRDSKKQIPPATYFFRNASRSFSRPS